jgi:transglutaminase-like putative cysteine protease
MMKYPPGLLAAALLFWAALNGTEAAAAPLLGLALLSAASRWRWRLDDRQFFRLGDLTSMLVLLSLAYVYATQSVDRPIYLILKWMPALFAPLLLAQLFSSAQTLPQGALFYSLRKRAPQRGLDFRVPYAGICVLAAGAANEQTPLYFFGAAAFFAWILFFARARGGSALLWLALVGTATASAYFGQQGLRHLQSWFEGQAEEWLADWAPDPFKSRTSIGDIGALKLSDKIEFRVEAGQPLLLHEASYDRYAGQSWYASQRKFKNAAFITAEAGADAKQMTFFRSFKRQAVLALPQGVEKITGLEGALLTETGFGVVKAEDVPDFVQFRVYYSGVQKSALTGYDREVPSQHQDWTRQIAAQLGLADESPAQAAALLRQFFRNRYRYSLYLGREPDADRALRDFVLNRKAGHCEYFAAATVLVLRRIGIPARFATGYSLQEYDPDQRLYIVRRRHAHAWALAFIDGRWQEVDATPPQWAELEAEEAGGAFQRVDDFFSRLAFEFKRWRSAGDNRQQVLGLCVAAALALYLGWRLYRNRAQWQRTAHGKPGGASASAYPGRDSAWYRLERALHGTLLARRGDESVREWGERLQQPALQEIARLHYRYRFDPDGLPAEEQARLQQAVQEWLTGWAAR